MMRSDDMDKVLVTGGAGFIGSNLVDALMSRGTVVWVFDNLSNGAAENVERWRDNPRFTFIRGDLLDPRDFAKLETYETVYHCAADPEVRAGSTNPNLHFQQNIVATKNLLEFTRKTQQNPTLVFSSTSTVYGESTKIPTSEDSAPFKPISVCGATKLAAHALEHSDRPFTSQIHKS
jgi:UDP-glucose 4-epimerase